VADLVATSAGDRDARRKAVEDVFKLREELRARGIRISRDEIIAWKNEGRR
jgi:hypothetical protein